MCSFFIGLGFAAWLLYSKGQKIEATSFRLNSQEEIFEMFGIKMFIWDQNLKENGEGNRIMKRGSSSVI